MLSFEGVAAAYGRVVALRRVDLQVDEGEIVALIGANGAGKTTSLRVASGLLRPTAGQVRFGGQPLGRLAPEELVARGMLHVPEGRRVFPGLTVRQNLEIATCGWRRRGSDIRAQLDRVFALFPRLRERDGQLGWSLSGGEQQMLAIGRAIMARPKLLLLDEPSLGLAPMLVRDVMASIVALNRDLGTTVLLVEQNAYLALKTASRAYVLENGETVLADEAPRLAENPRVKQAYLGG